MKNLWETTTHTNKYIMRVSEEQRERDMKNIERTNGLKHPKLDEIRESKHPRNTCRTRRKIGKKVKDLNNTINQPDLTRHTQNTPATA